MNTCRISCTPKGGGTFRICRGCECFSHYRRLDCVMGEW